MKIIPALILLAPLPALSAQQLPDISESDDRFGAAAATGDFNKDGFDDLAIGVPGESVKPSVLPGGPTFAAAGAVHVLYGAPATTSSPGLRAAGSRFFVQPAATPTTLGIGSGHAFGSALASGDFNGDGFDDLAIGIPGQRVGTLQAAGAVEIILGTSSGINPHTLQVVSQDSPLVADVAEAADRFGASLAVGDFDGDGFDDLAVGAPGESLGHLTGAGVVHVFRGTAAGIVPDKKSTYWSQGVPLADFPETDDAFGRSLAAGDVNGDGFDDLAIGVPSERFAAGPAGALHVLLGTSLGLSSSGNQFLHQDAPNVEGVGEDFDDFAGALCIGDFTADGFADLAVGVPQESTNGIRGGGVHMFFGSAAGPSTVNDRIVTEDAFIVFGDVEPDDRFGAQLCTWRLSPGGALLLSIGVPGEPIGQIPAAGGVHALGFGPTGDVGYSSFTNSAFDPFFGPPSSGCGFASTLVAADFNGDGYGDLAIGSPLRDRGPAQQAGELCVVYPTFVVSDRWHQGP